MLTSNEWLPIAPFLQQIAQKESPHSPRHLSCGTSVACASTSIKLRDSARAPFFASCVAAHAKCVLPLPILFEDGTYVQRMKRPRHPAAGKGFRGEQRSFPNFLTRNEMVGEKKVPFGVPREEIQWRLGGPVAQRIRSRGYEPRCRGSNPSSSTVFQTTLLHLHFMI